VSFRRKFPRAATILAAVVFLLALPSSPSAHDIPADTTIRMFIKPDGHLLHVLARVQMASINDIDWPTHKDGYLDLPRVDQFLRDAGTMWISDYMDLYEGNRKLNFPDVASVRLVTDDDPSFSDTYQAAADHMAGAKIPDDTKLFPLQGFLDVMFDYKIISPESSFSINPRFDRLGLQVTTVLKFTRANGAVRSFEYVGLPGLVRLDPSPGDAIWRFTQMGFFHLLGASEAVLFLLCLAMPFRRARGLAPAVAAFAVAFSLTLLATAAYHMAPGELWFQPFIATVLPLSIFYVAIENILGARVERRWAVALIFGLAYGFSFASSLQTMLQFAGSHPTISIVAYNAGLVVALLALVVLMVPAFEILFRFVAEERIGTIVLSAIVAHTAWHSLVARYAEVRRYPLHWPDFNLMLLASVLRWAMVAVVLAAAVWAIGLLRTSRVNGGYRESGLTGETEKRS
jgi:hypothetical protein